MNRFITIKTVFVSTVFSFHSFSSFCTHLVFLYLDLLLLYVQQLTISLCYFSHNVLAPKIAAFTVSCTPINPLPPSLLDRYNQSTILLGWNPLCIISNFLVLLSISSSWSLDHPRNAAEYLTSNTAQVLIALKTFTLLNFVPNTFTLLYSFLTLSFISLTIISSVSRIPKYYSSVLLLVT